MTRGDGGSYTLLVFAESRGMTPVVHPFTAGAEWTEVVVRWSDLGLDGRGIMGVVLAGGPAPGSFFFRIDAVRLQ